jgi:glycosyltransferase involved in cell wall biosynthesis
VSGGSLKIALVHSFYASAQPSGENRAVELQAAALRSRGHTVAEFSVRTDDVSVQSLYAVRSAAKVASGVGLNPLDEIRTFDPDITHIHNLFPNYGRRWVGRLQGPVVATLHNFRPLCPAGTFFRDGRVCTTCLDSRSALPAVRHKCYRDRRAQTLPLAISTRFDQDPLLRRADALIVLNPKMEDLYSQAGIDRKKLVTVPNFVPGGQAGPGGDRWVYAGRISPEKGIVELLKVWPESIPLDVLGDGPAMAEARRIAPMGVVFHGNSSPATVSGYMKHARGLVFSSQWYEGLPTVYLEALSCGTPTLSFGPNSVSSLVAREGTGLVGSLDAVETSLEKASTAFSELRSHCRRVFDNCYSEDAWLNNIFVLYSLAMDAARARR